MASPWPGGARIAVMLTFDFDAESGWLSRDPSHSTRPGVLSQGRYGAQVGVPRLLDVLAQERVPATFFIPGWVAEHHPDPCRKIATLASRSVTMATCTSAPSRRSQTRSAHSTGA